MFVFLPVVILIARSCIRLSLTISMFRKFCIYLLILFTTYIVITPILIYNAAKFGEKTIYHYCY